MSSETNRANTVPSRETTPLRSEVTDEVSRALRQFVSASFSPTVGGRIFCDLVSRHSVASTPDISLTAQDFSIWLTPDEESNAYRQLQETIDELPSAHADAPVFEPHVTVVGGVDGDRESLEETTRSLTDDTKPVEVTFGEVRCSTTTHQCVFRLVDPSLALFELYASARDALELSMEAYNPHLSLVYSDMGFADRLALANAVDVDALPEEVALPTLELVATGGPVSEWESVCTVPL